MSFDTGTSVRTLVDLLASDGSIIPIGRLGLVIGSTDQQLIIEFDDHSTGERITATAHPWECLRVARGVR